MKKMTANFMQRGVTLLELMIAMTISLVVSLAMVTLMSNTLGTGSDTIAMARMTEDMRAAMQIMTRDLRRANFHANFAKCYGTWNCRASLDDGNVDASNYIRTITIGDSVGTDDCFFYWLDRDADGVASNDDDVGAFRRAVVGGVGVIQMTTTRNTAPTCNSGSYWFDITDSDFINVTSFDVDNTLSYSDTALTGTANINVQKITMTMTAQLIRNATIQRSVEDTIRVRNDIFTAVL